MLKVILNAPHPLTPFNEPARDLRIHNVPLWLHQRNILAPYTTHELELKPGQRFPLQREESLVYRDNLFFDEEYFRLFITAARKRGKPCRAAFSADDPAFRKHALPLSTSYTPAGNFYLADLWYYPRGPVADVEPLVIDLDAREIGYYHVPTYMADQSGDLVVSCRSPKAPCSPSGCAAVCSPRPIGAGRGPGSRPRPRRHFCPRSRSGRDAS